MTRPVTPGIAAGCASHGCSDRLALGRVAAGVEDDDVRRPTPTPKAFSVRWLASYAGLAGTEKLWYQRFETFPAAKPPKIVSTIQTAMTGQRCRVTRWASRASTEILSIDVDGQGT